jgi:tRNA pseudouridine38-40 synthase
VRVRIDLAYDGTAFHGFARQPEIRTVQGVLEDALGVLCRQPVTTTCAGRTDRGVHALAQVVHADLPDAAGEALPTLRRGLAALVGEELAIWSVREVGAEFDARFSARLRRYRYALCDADACSPLERHTVWRCGEPALDVDAMRVGGAHLVGEHDFSSFCRRAGERHLVRRVTRVAVTRPAEGRVHVEVDGRAFCRQMVRSIVGCLLRVGRGRLEPGEVADVLAARDRARAGAIAPPHGLTLVGVEYT